MLSCSPVIIVFKLTSSVAVTMMREELSFRVFLFYGEGRREEGGERPEEIWSSALQLSSTYRMRQRDSAYIELRFMWVHNEK